MKYTQERNTAFFPRVLEGAIQLMVRVQSAVGGVKQRQTQKKNRFSARMARMKIGDPIAGHPRGLSLEELGKLSNLGYAEQTGRNRISRLADTGLEALDFSAEGPSWSFVPSSEL
jgi:hypothetical protein